MKLLIIAGPYEADRIRRAAISAGFDAVAVEPGESLSGWISATQPDLIVMAPQMVNPDPSVALAKVRATPRGRVPIFFVGDAADEERFKNLADGFFVRPIAPADLVAQARDRVLPSADRSGPASARTSGPRDLPAALGLRPRALPGAPQDLMRHLADSIDASLDAEMRDVARGLVVETASAPSAVAPHQSGAIGTPDVALLFGRIACDRLNGRLTFRRGLVKKVIYFERGAPVLATSNLPDDRMGEMLARQGRLSRDQRIRGSRLLESTGRRFGSVLVEIGALKESELGSLVQRHFEEIIYSVFAWPELPPGPGEAPFEDGEWVLGPERAATDEPIRLDLPAPALIMEGIRRKYTGPRLSRRLGGGGQVVRLLATGASLSAVLDDMALSDEERTLARRFDGVRTLAEVCAGAQVAEETGSGLAWALVALRLALATQEVGARAGAGNATTNTNTNTTTTTTTTTSASTSGSGGTNTSTPSVGQTTNGEGKGEREIDRARVLARYALVQEGDYFEVLGVPREATAHEVRRAHQSLSREMSAASLDPVLVGELEPQLGAIRTVLDEGARVLGDAQLRQRYQAHLPGAPAARAE